MVATGTAVREIGADQFDVVVGSGDVVVEFFATWCGSCLRVAPVLDAISADLAGSADFVKVNVDEAAELVARYDVRSTPTLLVFRDGLAVGDPLVGAHPEATVRQMITAALASSSTPRADDRLAWVPVDACTLPTAEQPFRVAEFTALFAESLRGIERPAGAQLRLVIDAAAEERARDLAVRESSCCSFFTFDFERAADGQVWMQVGVPAERVSVLDGLAAQAAAASGVAQSK